MVVILDRDDYADCDDCEERYYGEDIGKYLREFDRSTSLGVEIVLLCQTCAPNTKGEGR